MSLDIESALRESYDRTVARSGLILVGVYFVVSLLSAVASDTQAAQTADQFEDVPFFADAGILEPGPFAVPSLPSAVVSLLSIATFVATVVVAITIYRVFASDERETVPEEAYKRDIGVATLNGVVATIIFGVLVAIGLVLLVIPGIFIAVSLLFFLVFVALEDDSFLDALQSSWGLTKGRRLSVFLLLIALLIISVVVTIVGGIAAAVFGSIAPVLGSLVGIAVSSALFVFNLGVITDAYFQLREEKDAAPAGEADVPG